MEYHVAISAEQSHGAEPPSSAHTPGPWTAANRGSDEEPMMSVMAGGVEVAIAATGDVPQEIEDANARLIAAAPDMLAALRLILDWSDEFCRTGKCPTYDAPSHASAAIAKATGGK